MMLENQTLLQDFQKIIFPYVEEHPNGKGVHFLLPSWEHMRQIFYCIGKKLGYKRIDMEKTFSPFLEKHIGRRVVRGYFPKELKVERYKKKEYIKSGYFRNRYRLKIQFLISLNQYRLSRQKKNEHKIQEHINKMDFPKKVTHGVIRETIVLENRKNGQRNGVFAGCIEIDINHAHQSTIKDLCDKANMKCPHLNHFLQHRSEIYKSFVDRGMNEKDVKNAFTTIFHGNYGAKQPFPSMIINDPFHTKLRTEIRKLGRMLTNDRKKWGSKLYFLIQPYIQRFQHLAQEWFGVDRIKYYVYDGIIVDRASEKEISYFQEGIRSCGLPFTIKHKELKI